MNKRIAICIPSYKNRYSNLLSNLVNIDKKYDIYVFLSENDFEKAFLECNDNTNNERYVAPLYNCMIKDGKKIKVKLIDKSEVIFCATPEEYEKYIKTLFRNE